MKQTSWPCTLVIQLSLCIAVYVALNIGHPHTPHHPPNFSVQPIYFITVAGGFRPLHDQTLLLQLIGKAAKAYKAHFVIDITKFGRSDPLLQNATMIPELQNIPWYTTRVLGDQGETFLLKKIEAPYGQTVDIIVLDTTLFQGTSGVHGNNQIQWLTRTLNESSNDRRIIVVGYHNLISCDSDPQKMEEGKGTTFEIRDILLSHGVEAYISTTACAGNSQDEGMELSLTCLDTENQKAILNNSFRGTFNGFLIHQISSLEMATIVVKPTGEIERKISFPQRGRTAI